MIGRWGPWDIPQWARRRGPDVVMHFKTMYCAVRVVGDDHPRLEAGLRERAVIGTGFLVNVPSETIPNGYYPYVVTAAHVIANQQKMEVEVSIPRPSGGMYEPVVVSDWHRPLPNVDLAVAFFPSTGEHKAIYGVDEADLVPNQWIQMLSLGGEVAYVGILTPLDRPMVRTGTIGAIDQEKLELEGYDYTGHLIDCRSYGGFSGSPVFAGIAKPGLGVDAEYNGLPLGTMVYFGFVCGMFTEHLAEKNEWASSRYGVGVMVRSIEIREALMSPELRRERQKEDEKNQQAKGDDPKLTKVHTNPTDQSEFIRFEDLTRKLVSVSKADIEKPKSD